MEHIKTGNNIHKSNVTGSVLCAPYFCKLCKCFYVASQKFCGNNYTICSTLAIYNLCCVKLREGLSLKTSRQTVSPQYGEEYCIEKSENKFVSYFHGICA